MYKRQVCNARYFFSEYHRLGVPGSGAEVIHDEDGRPVRARFGPTQVRDGACYEMLMVAVLLSLWVMVLGLLVLVLLLAVTCMLMLGHGGVGVGGVGVGVGVSAVVGTAVFFTSNRRHTLVRSPRSQERLKRSGR